jgi:hypothetical protein
VFEVDSGVIEFVVSAEHGGSVVSLSRDGVEMVHSSYPEAHAYQWANPWYGGLRATGGNERDRRHHLVERRAKAVEVEGAQGLAWKGVEVDGRFTHPDLRWLRYSVRYLTTAGSNLLAVLITAQNTTRAVMGTSVGVELWPARERRRFHIEHEGKVETWAPDGSQYGMPAATWAAFDVARNAVLAVVPCRRSEPWRLDAEHIKDGYRLADASVYAHLHPRVRRWSEMFWVVATRSVEEAYAYRFLADLDELP